MIDGYTTGQPADQELHRLVDPEILGYNDGTTALYYGATGSELKLGPGSEQIHAREFGLNARAMINTGVKSYALGRGLILDLSENTAFPLPGDLEVAITIGEPCTLPGVGETGEVKSVALRYKSGEGSQQVDRPSPFVELERLFDIVESQQLGQASRQHP